MLKENCIYYNPIQKGYYLTYSIDDEMVYGRRGIYLETSNLEEWINRDGPGLVFKIGDFIICSDYIRNYFLDEKDLESFELVRELTNEEFSIIEILIDSNYNFPPALIDIDKFKDNTDISIISLAIKDRKERIAKLKSEIYNLEEDLYKTIYM